MKANAPEKIYFTQTENGTYYYTEGVPSERNHIEYTRTDAFIEKAEEYIYKQLNEGRIECGDIEKFIDAFRKYIKGE